MSFYHQSTKPSIPTAASSGRCKIQARTPGFGARPRVSRRESIVADVPDRATQAIPSAEAWFGHGAFADMLAKNKTTSFGRACKENTRVLGLPIFLDVTDRLNQAAPTGDGAFRLCARIS